MSADLGAQYVAAIQLGGVYAYAGRDWVYARVARLLGTTIVEEVHNHHNFAWLPEVLTAHDKTIRVLHTLTPLGVAMAGANEFDPYKD
ncbi:hypothetical protein [Edaphobacter albus]|uniref:hypothetical protein n=1 Tax=Edaphobacter sp. 4G125 TaxID=2763071 RepID=UPI001C991B4A|nr:hypothetical protein [Edaphobacter sp. 4G125]